MVIKKTALVLSAIFMVLAVITVGCVREAVVPVEVTEGQPTEQPSGEQTGDQQEETGETFRVDMRDLKYSPETVTIRTGDTVVWTNSDDARHTVTSESGAELGSGELSEGQTYSHTFDQEGTYDYYCTLHPFMKGRVVVRD